MPTTPPSPTLTEHNLPWDKTRGRDRPREWRLVIAWSFDEPARVGESATVAAESVLGRGTAPADETTHRLVFHARRPGAATPGPALGASRLSRSQLRLKPTKGDAILVESIGKCPLLFEGAEVTRVEAHEGDVLVLRNALVLHVLRQPPLATLVHHPAPDFPFGMADPHGIVGESAAAWRLRDTLALTGRSPHHVLVLGESGVGKELAARAVHGFSARGSRPIVSRNAATFPAGLVDAELFGTAKSYPNAGSPERAGLIGEAHGSTLFLDEIGELPLELQARLLRVFDAGGEYQRLGETGTRKADVRVVAATNRPLDSLKHDVLARFPSRVTVPPLGDRPEDIPLLVRHILARFLHDMPELEARIFERREGALHARIDPRLLEALLRHEYDHHLRELERLLWLAVSTSREDYVGFTDEVAAELQPAAGDEPKGAEPTADAVREALATTQGVSQAARALGMPNRYALYRLMRRHGITRE